MERPRIIDRDALPAQVCIVDAYTSAVLELCAVVNPTLPKQGPERAQQEEKFMGTYADRGVYIYFPWRNTVVHTLNEQDYFTLRTARNREVILATEQQEFRKGRVGIAGLSVGSAVLQTLVMSGGPKELKIADLDVVEITNLNRLRATVLDVGSEKVEVAARATWEIDPFAHIEIFPEGITMANIETFLCKPRLSVCVDEIESIPFKIRLREVARRERIPVVMATDNGNGIILDIERFDEDRNRPLFHGLIDDIRPGDLEKISYREWLELATRVVGPEYLGERMRNSLLRIGKTIPSVPQLGASAAFAGAAVTYAVRHILTKVPMPSGRYHFTLEEMFDASYRSPEHEKERLASSQQFLKALRNPPSL
ncbi:MAG: ThiF family adenylyltransferase [Patescibacteria group bacterium]